MPKKDKDRIKELKFTNKQKGIINRAIREMDKEYNLLEFYPELAVIPLPVDGEDWGEANPALQQIKIMPALGDVSFRDTAIHECFHLLCAACQGMYDDKECNYRKMEEKLIKILTKHEMMPTTRGD